MVVKEVEVERNDFDSTLGVAIIRNNYSDLVLRFKFNLAEQNDRPIRGNITYWRR